MRGTGIIGFGFMIGSLLSSCSGNDDPRIKEREKKDSTASVTANYQKPPSSYRDTLAVSAMAAVFYSPDSLQWKKLEAIVQKNVYETERHNCFYQMRNARIVIKKYYPNVRIIETSSVRFLLFIKEDSSRICLDLDTKGDMCGVFLFNRKKDPELIDMMNVDTALEFYFKN